MKVLRVVSWVPIVSILLFIAAVTVLGFITPGYSHVSHTISRLSLGAYGNIANANLIQLAVGGLILGIQLALSIREPHVRFTVLPFFLLASMSLVGAARFPTDVIAGDLPLTITNLSTNGLMHTASVTIFVLLCPITIFLMVKAMISDPSWRDVARWTVAMSLVSITLSYIWVVFYVYHMFYDYRGMFQKIIVLWTLLWMLLVAFKTVRKNEMYR
jgi:hypothetical protein